MLSLLLITALAVQYPQTSKPTTDSTAQRRGIQAAPRGTSQSAIGRQAFHDRMRELWTDHVVYTRNFIISAAAGLPDTAQVAQRLLRNQDELGETFRPYYGDASATRLASLLRNHIQLVGKTMIAAQETTTAMSGMNMNMRDSRMGDTVSTRTDTAQARASGYVQNGGYASSQSQMQTAQVDSNALNQAIAELKANGDSIATFLASANSRGFARETLRGALQMHISILLKEATAQIKKDWSGSMAAFDESERQAWQMADLLSDGIMKQFPSRFSTKATAVSSR